jgi:hypothetical protein
MFFVMKLNPQHLGFAIGLKLSKSHDRPCPEPKRNQTRLAQAE